MPNSYELALTDIDSESGVTRSSETVILHSCGDYTRYIVRYVT